jgi:cytochrome c oxidase subunit II
MRRRLASGLAVAALAAVAAGCGARGVVAPLPSEVKGPLPKPTAVAAGNAANGKALFLSNGCGGCHTYAPAGTKGKIGPDLARLAADAATAKMLPVSQYAAESIKNPSGYVVPGYNNVMPSFATLGDKKIADLVAFVTQSKAG